MSSPSIVNTLLRSSARAAPRIPQHAKRTYATEGPPMSQGGRNKPIIIAALAAIPIMAFFLIPPRAEPAPNRANVSQPNLDPAAKQRSRRESEPPGVGVKYVHPEHMDPEEFKPPFGQIHKAKRVDTPPEGRHHQALTDRARRE